MSCFSGILCGCELRSQSDRESCQVSQSLGSAEGEIQFITTIVSSFLQGKIQACNAGVFFCLSWKTFKLDFEVLTYFKLDH